jgi:hypothetical protein
MRIKNILWLLLCSLVPIIGCKKEEESPKAPIITYLSLSADSVEQFNNAVVLRFSYEDYQGDLGEPDADDYSLRIKDARISEYDWYHIPTMTPELEELHIKGTYELTLDPLFLLSSGQIENTNFTFQIRDREGNWSNELRTDFIAILDSL